VAKLTAVCGRRGAKHPFPIGAGTSMAAHQDVFLDGFALAAVTIMCRVLWIGR
jgi:hypothetical protein